MKKFIVALCVAAMLSLVCFSAFAVGTETVAKTKNRDIKITVIDDFSTYSGEVGPCGNAFYTYDGEKLTFAIESGYAFGGPSDKEYKSPAASADGIKELYNNAKYIGMRIKNTGGVEVSLALEKRPCSNGSWCYYAEVPDFAIPDGVPQNLQGSRLIQKKEFERHFSVHFTPEGNDRKRLGVFVHIIPLAKFLIQRGGDLQFVQIQRCADPRDANLRGVDTGAGSNGQPDGVPVIVQIHRKYSRP